MAGVQKPQEAVIAQHSSSCSIGLCFFVIAPNDVVFESLS